MKINLDELSKKYEIPKPTLNARLKRIEQKNKHLKLSYKEKNILYLTELGQELLEAELKENPYKKKAFKKNVFKNDFKKTLKSDLKTDLKTENNLNKDIKKLEKELQEAEIKEAELNIKIKELNIRLEAKEEISSLKDELIAQLQKQIEALEQTNKLLLVNIDLKDKLQAKAIEGNQELVKTISQNKDRSRVEATEPELNPSNNNGVEAEQSGNITQPKGIKKLILGILNRF